jgi:hypothetical protein
MKDVIHTCEVVYGSYSGTVKVRCDQDDDLEIVKARIRKQERLDFLSMATYQVKITNTEALNDE